MIPEDLSYRTLVFHTLREGLRSPVEFRQREDGSLLLLVERYVYRKKD